MPDDARSSISAAPSTRGAWIAPLYFLVYLAYLFRHPESETVHWLSLVLVPFVLVLAVQWRSPRRIRAALASVGLERERATRGLLAALLLGVAIGLVQVFASRNSQMILDAFRSGRAAWLLPVSFLLMLLTAGFTEEFFFRGFLQTRLESLLGSRWAALALAALAFGLYHVPYAYFNPHWPSAGNWPAALGTALAEGVPAGLILGGLYVGSRRNLVACIVLHSLIDAFPAMGLLHFG